MKWATSRAVFVDLDSTLADTRHRWHLIGQGEERENTDWVAYSMACADDAPLEASIRFVSLLAHGCVVVVLSGRYEESRDLTEAWLEKHGVAYDELILKNVTHHDHLTNEEYKREMVEDWCARYPGIEPVLMIDDWPPVRDEMAKIGVPTLIVTPAYDGSSSLFGSALA